MPGLDKDMEPWELSYITDKNIIWYFKELLSHFDKVILIKLNISSSDGPAIPLQVIYTRDSKTYFQTKLLHPCLWKHYL